MKQPSLSVFLMVFILLRNYPCLRRKEGKQNLLEGPQKQHLALFLPQAHQLQDHTPIHIHHKRTSS